MVKSPPMVKALLVLTKEPLPVLVNPPLPLVVPLRVKEVPPTFMVLSEAKFKVPAKLLVPVLVARVPPFMVKASVVE